MRYVYQHQPNDMSSHSAWYGWIDFSRIQGPRLIGTLCLLPLVETYLGSFSLVSECGPENSLIAIDYAEGKVTITSNEQKIMRNSDILSED